MDAASYPTTVTHRRVVRTTTTDDWGFPVTRSRIEEVTEPIESHKARHCEADDYMAPVPRRRRVTVRTSDDWGFPVERSYIEEVTDYPPC